MNNFKQAVAAVVLAGSMALAAASGVSADGPSPQPARPAPTGTVTFFINGMPSTASFNPYEIAIVEKVPPAPQAAPLVPDNEWKYVPVRR